MSRKSWIIHFIKKSSSGVDKAARDGAALFDLRGKLIGYLIIIAIVASPFLIFNIYKSNHPEKFCAHEKLDSDGARFDYEEKTVRLPCAECGTYFAVDSRYTVLEDVAPTCSSRGKLTERLTSNVSGSHYDTKTTYIDKLPHTNELYQERIEPTCTTTGQTAVYRCTVCDTYTGGDDIKHLGHTRTISLKGYSATCMITGRTDAYSCATCGVVLETSTITPKADHKCEVTTVPPEDYSMGYDLHECIWCDYSYRDNYVDSLVQVLKFSEYGDHCTVIGTKVKTEHVIVPEYYNGKPVTSIEFWAFQNNTTIKEITLPSTLTTIRERAFEGCTNLEKIYFSEGLETIEGYAFWKCTALEELTFPKTLKAIYASSFAECTALKRISYHEECTLSTFPAFDSATHIVSVKLPGQISFNSFVKENLESLPILAEIYMSEQFKSKLPEDFLAKYNIKTDYSLESSVFKEGENYYMEQDGKYYLVALFDQSSCPTLPQTVKGHPWALRLASLIYASKNLAFLTIPSTEVSFYTATCKTLYKQNVPFKMNDVTLMLLEEKPNATFFENFTGSIVLTNATTTIDRYDLASNTIFFEGTKEECDSIVYNYYRQDNVWVDGQLQRVEYLEPRPWTHSNIYYYSDKAPTEAGRYWHWENGKPAVW